MEVNKIVPIETRDRICVHCDDDTKTTYLIAEPRQGKTTETVRQAIFRRCHILSKEYDYFKSLGMKHITETKDLEIGFMGIRDFLNPEQKNMFKNKDKVKLCVDGAKGILEDLLSLYFEVPIEIEYMSIEAPRSNV